MTEFDNQSVYLLTTTKFSVNWIKTHMSVKIVSCFIVSCHFLSVLTDYGNFKYFCYSLYRGNRFLTVPK